MFVSSRCLRVLQYRQALIKLVLIFGAFTGAGVPLFAQNTASSLLDTVILGDQTSEAAHGLAANNAEIINGGMGLVARRTLPLSPAQVNGGNLTFNMAVDPSKRNYFTIKLWSDDNTTVNTGRIYLYIPDSQFNPGSTKMYQVGYRHEGDYMAALANSMAKSPIPGRFYYSTILLPLSMTAGRTSLQLRIQTTGRLYTLGSGGPPNGNYQFVQNLPSVTMYRAYTHTQPYLDVQTEVQGAAPATSIQPNPTDSILAPGGAFYNGVVNFINGRLNASLSSLGTENVEVLARSYTSQALPFYQSQVVLDKVVAALDNFAIGYYANPNGAVSAGGNEGWGGRFGYLGWAIHLVLPYLGPYLDQTVNYGSGGTLTRRAAWSQMLFASREYGRTTRDSHLLTNQGLLANTNIYQANRGLADLGDGRAFAESDAQRYLLEAGGIQPMLGSDIIGGGSTLSLGNNYLEVSPKGNTREWGFVASNYGEMQGHLADFYVMTGNPAFRDQAIKMVKGKSYFRRPAIEPVGGQFYQSMQDIGLLAWRGANESDSNGFATEQVYGDRTGANWGLHCAAVTQDPTLVGYAKQLLADNQLFTQLLYSADYGQLSSIDIFDEYQLVKNLPDSGIRLPMTPGQPDGAFSDEVTGAIAIHHGSEYLWAAPFYQAKAGTGINSIARFHYSTPTYDQYGLMETNAIAPIGSTPFVRPDLIDKPEGNGYLPPDNPSNAYAGETIMVAPAPAGASLTDPFRGRADFWAFRFGHFLIGMNPSEQVYNLTLPSDLGTTTDLISGGSLTAPTTPVYPQNSVAVYIPASSTSDGTVDTCPAASSPNATSYTATALNVTLSWTRAAGATSYNLLRRFSNEADFTEVASGITTLQFTDSVVLDANNPPYYRVIGINACGAGYTNTTAGPVYSTVLPGNFTSLDIGTVASPGSASYQNGVFSVAGSGSDIGSTNDNFQFAYFGANQDGDYIVRILNADAVKGGLMIRNTLDKNSSMAYVMLNSSLARYAVRSTLGGNAIYTNGPAASTLPLWLRLNKNGSVITGFSSFDGVSWTQIASSQITIGGTFYVGLAVTSRNSYTQTARFDSLSTPAPLLSLQLQTTTLTYPNSTNAVISVPSNGQGQATGNVLLYDGTTLLSTLPLQGDGNAYHYFNPSLTVGSHMLQAFYGGDTSHQQGMSAPIPVLVVPAPVTLSAACWNPSSPYGSSYNCNVNLSSSAGTPTGQVQIEANTDPPVTAALTNGSLSYTIPRPNAGNHIVRIVFPPQGNFAGSAVSLNGYVITPAPTQIQLSPSSYYQGAGSDLALNASLTSWSAGAPTDGFVSFWDAGTLLGTLPAGRNVMFTVRNRAVGIHTYSATYAPGPSGNFAAASSGQATVQIH